MSRPSTPNGGTPDEIIDLRDSGYCSTGELARHLGLPGIISATWIMNELKIKPKVSLRKGLAMFWSPDQIPEIRQAIILRLINDEFKGST